MVKGFVLPRSWWALLWKYLVRILVHKFGTILHCALKTLMYRVQKYEGLWKTRNQISAAAVARNSFTRGNISHIWMSLLLEMILLEGKSWICHLPWLMIFFSKGPHKQLICFLTHCLVVYYKVWADYKFKCNSQCQEENLFDSCLGCLAWMKLDRHFKTIENSFIMRTKIKFECLKERVNF